MPVVATDRKPNVRIRWAIRRDLIDVLEIESLCFEYTWSEDDFIRCLRQSNCIAMVAEIQDAIAGFMVYELSRTQLHLLNFAVLPAMQGRGVGRAMADKLIGKLSAKGRQRIACEVRESNLDAQLFFKAMGFRAVSVFQDFYSDTDEDAYLFQYRYRPIA